MSHLRPTLVLLGTHPSETQALATALQMCLPGLRCRMPSDSRDLATAVAADALYLLLARPFDAIADAQQTRHAEASDARWRQALQASGLPFRVIHGTRDEQLRHVLRTLDPALAPLPRGHTASAWKASCEKCSDPQCEHLLFRRLLATDAAARADT